MKNLIKSVLIFSIVALSFNQCKKDDDTVTTKEGTFVVNASSLTRWIYFSFEKGDTVSVTDTANATNWDIAFKSNFIKTNSGTSGKNGKGGAYLTKKVDVAGFDSLKVVSDTATFSIDVKATLTGALGTPVSDNYSMPLCAWYNYDHVTHALSSKKNVFVVKTASGKYAKFIILSSYAGSDDSIFGYFKIQYKYQDDGSKNLE